MIVQIIQIKLLIIKLYISDNFICFSDINGLIIYNFNESFILTYYIFVPYIKVKQETILDILFIEVPSKIVYILSTDNIVTYTINTNKEINFQETSFQQQNDFKKLYYDYKNNKLYLITPTVINLIPITIIYDIATNQYKTLVDNDIIDISKNYYLNKYNDSYYIKEYDYTLNNATTIYSIINHPIKTFTIVGDIMYLYLESGLYRYDTTNKNIKKIHNFLIDDFSKNMKLFSRKIGNHIDIFLYYDSKIYCFNNDTYCIINGKFSKIYDGKSSFEYLPSSNQNILTLTNILNEDIVSVASTGNSPFLFNYLYNKVGTDIPIISEPSNNPELYGDHSKYYNLKYNIAFNTVNTEGGKLIR